jgi:hypothetical protein
LGNPVKRAVVGVALWTVLFIVLAPDVIRDGREFYLLNAQAIAFGIGLAVCVYAAVRIVTRLLGSR